MLGHSEQISLYRIELINLIKKIRANPDELYAKEVNLNQDLIRKVVMYAKAGSVELQYLLACLEALSPTDPNKHVKWLEFAARQGHAHAILDFAKYLSEGRYNVKRNLDEAFNFLQILIESDNLNARKKALHYIEESNDRKEWYQIYKLKNNEKYASVDDLFKLIQVYCGDVPGFIKNDKEAMRLIDICMNHENESAKPLVINYLKEHPVVDVAYQKYLKVNADKIVVIRNKIDYFRLTNRSNLDCKEDKELEHLKDQIKLHLGNPNSEFYKSIKKMTPEEKAELIKAFITNDTKMLVELLHHRLKEAGIDVSPEILKRITENKYKRLQDENWLNTTVTNIIQTAFTDKNNRKLNLGYRKDIIRKVMQSLTDDYMDIPTKVKISLEIDEEAAKAESHFSYDELTKPLEKSRFRESPDGKESKFSGKVSENELTSILKYSQLDMSEFILIITGFLSQKLSNLEAWPKIKIQLDEIKKIYVDLNYEEAIKIIKVIALEFKHELGDNHVQLITNAIPKLKEVEIEKNHSRRFFETRLSQLHMGTMNEVKGIHKIIHFLVGMNVTTGKEAVAAVLALSKWDDQASIERMVELTDLSKLYNSRLKAWKRGFGASGEDQSDMDSIYSRNRGVMTSLSPMFYDELGDIGVRNRTVDIRTMKGYEDKPSYSMTNKRGAFAGSLSGHVYFYVALLEKYMKANKNDPNLNADINQFVKTVAAGYISQGYHGYLEVLDAFTDVGVTRIFREYGVVIDKMFQLEVEVLNDAFLDAQQYAKLYCMKGAAHDAIFRSPLIEKSRLSENLHEIIKEKDLKDEKALRDMSICFKNRIFPTNKDKLILLAKAREGFVLHDAIFNNCLHLVDYLSKNGIDVNRVNTNGYTPVNLAIHRGHFDIALNLIVHGANPFIHTTEQEFAELIQGCLKLNLSQDMKNLVINLFIKRVLESNVHNGLDYYSISTIDLLIQGIKLISERKAEYPEYKVNLQSAAGEPILDVLSNARNKKLIGDELAKKFDSLYNVALRKKKTEFCLIIKSCIELCSQGQFEHLYKQVESSNILVVMKASPSKNLSAKMLELSVTLFKEACALFHAKDYEKLPILLKLCQVLMGNCLDEKNLKSFNYQCSKYLEVNKMNIGIVPQLALSKMANIVLLHSEGQRATQGAQIASEYKPNRL